MRKALIVGIDFYKNFPKLHGCVNDAHEVNSVLETHTDGSINFGVKLMTSTNEALSIDRKMLKGLIEELFNDKSDIALFYFSGHGYIESTGGYLVCSDSIDGDDGVSLNDVLSIVNSSEAKNKVVILDCCHSGVAGSNGQLGDKTILDDGVTILTASSKKQYAKEIDGYGVFTSLFVDALRGGAANLVGDVTPGSVYAHIDQALGPWEQRPIFKTNVERFISLRKVQPPIQLGDLKYITTFFPNPGYSFSLDPSYEFTSDSADDDNLKVFKILQKYNNINLLRPEGEDHMYFAAMNSKSCKLTALGVHYWRLVKNKKI